MADLRNLMNARMPPAAVAPEAVATLLDEAAAQRDALVAVGKTMKDRRNAEGQAAAEDRATAARALRSGAKMTGTPNADKVRARFDELAREQDARREALAGIAKDIATAVQDAAPTWTANIAGELGAAQGAAATKLDEAAQLVDLADLLIGLAAWVEDGGTGSFRVGRHHAAGQPAATTVRRIAADLTSPPEPEPEPEPPPVPVGVIDVSRRAFGAPWLGS